MKKLVFIGYFCMFLNFLQGDSGNYIPNIMKRMAPYSNNELPKGTKYFIRKHQLIRSTGIELEDDGQMVKLHPDLNGSDAHLYPEYPLKMYLEEIKLEIYLNSTISSQWSSKGSAKFCLSHICTKVFIDDTSTFSGIFSELPTKYIFENLSPNVEHLNLFTTLTNASVIGTLVDSYNSKVVIDGNIFMNQDYKCNESFSISRKTPQHFFDSINKTILFDSIFIISQNCFNVLPSKILKIFVSPTLLNYDKLEKITSESLLMNKNAFRVLIEHQFKKKCYYKNDYSLCDEEKISNPDLQVSVWVESDSNYDEPTIKIKLNDLITEIKSKKLSSLTNEFFEKISSESHQKNDSLKNTMNMLNLTEAKKISINSDKNEFLIHFNSSDHENSCLSVGDLAVCDWQAVLRLFKTQIYDEKCSEINITGNGKALFEKSNFGSVEIKIKQSCNGENNFSMRVNINEITVYKIFEYIGKNINMNDDLLKIFDSRNFENLKSLQSERISNNLDEFLSERIPNIIKGYTWIPGLNSTIPFALNVNSKEKTEKAFKNLCLFLNQNSTLKFISKLTSLEQNLLPSILENSSVCIQPKKNASMTKHDVHIRLPINIMSKCFTTDLLCPFLNIVIGEKLEGVLFEGIVKDTSLNLKSPVTPIGDFFNHFNLHNCFIKYKIKNKENISVYMKCRIDFSEIGYNISIFFVPFYKEEELSIMSFIKHTNKSYPKLFGIDQFRYRNMNAKFLLKKKMKKITLKLGVYYSEFGISSSSQPPTAYLHIDLKNKNNSLVHLIIPPYSITDISKILGFGECPALLSIITDTLEEWELRVVGLPFNSNQSILSIYGLNLVQNSLFNSTIQVSNKIQQSKIILRGVKPIIIPINHINEQAVFNSYSDINQGPSIVLNMECACENICEEDKIGDIISDIDILGISNAIKINVTYNLPWEGTIISHNFLNQNIKTKITIKLFSFEGPIEMDGVLLDIGARIVNKIQSNILRKSKQIIDKLIQFEKELDTILHVLNKIRSDKIDVQLKLDEIKKKLEEDTTIEIVYQTSLNLTCREEICDRICVGCATSLSCAIKDILGSCVSLPNWDMKCGCSRDPLCLLYNDACDEIIEMSKTQLKIYDNTKNIQKSLYESYIKNYEDISRDEAKTELLYSTAMRITLKTIKEMRHKLNEANNVQKDIPIIKWLKVYDIQISLFENINETNNDTKTTNQRKNFCIFLKIHYNNRKSKTIRKNIKYCPYIDDSLIDHVVYKISKDLFPQLCDVLIDEKHQPTRDIMGLDSDEILKKFVNKKLFKNMKNQSLLVLKNKKTNEISRIRRSYPHENYLRKIIHPNPSFINRFILSKPIHNIIGFKRTPNDTNEFDQEEAHWMIPHTLKGRCRVLLNIIDILNDLLKTIHHLKLNQKKSTDIFNKQKLNLLLNKDYYLQKLKDSGDQLNLIIGEQNNSFFHITSRFSQGVDIYIRNLEESLSEIEMVVMNEWRKSLTERIKKMGGKGIERFIQNLNDVIKTLLKTKPDTNSLFTQIQKQNSDIILLMVKNIKSAILERDLKKDTNSVLKKEYEEAKKLKRIIKSTCH